MKKFKGKLIQFGAGKIGRSFIGQLFSRGGYEVVFVDIAESIIHELNIRKSYKVVIKTAKADEVLEINNVRGYLLAQRSQIASEISSSDIVAVSVGQKGLAAAIETIAEGLKMRFIQSPEWPLDIIIAENMRNASQYFYQALQLFLPKNYPLDSLVGLVETSIGKMVPIMLESDIQQDVLQVFAESYNSLVLDKKAFKNPIPELKGLSPKENMKAWVDRKLFIHNLGHAVAAYTGYFYYPHLIYLWQVLEKEKVIQFTKQAMLQSANILQNMYPEEFSETELVEHIDDLLFRFQNKALGDTIFRVGCDLSRKLNRDDRLLGAIIQGSMTGLPYDKIKLAFAYAFHFQATNEHGKRDPNDELFLDEYRNQGAISVLENKCGLTIMFEKELIYELKNCIESVPKRKNQ